MLEEDKGSSLTVDMLIAPRPAIVDGKNTWVIDAKELYNFLKPPKLFREWIEDLIEAYGYVENTDFVGSVERGDLLITLPMAREISMTVPTQAGRQARFYLVALSNQQPEETEDDSETDSEAESSSSEEVRSGQLQSSEETEETEEYEEAEESEAESELQEDYVDFVEASKELGVGIQFLYQYMEDIGWLVPETDEPRIWTVRKGWMVYDLEHADETGTPGLLTSEGFDIIQDKLIKLGVLSLVPE